MRLTATLSWRVDFTGKEMNMVRRALRQSLRDNELQDALDLEKHLATLQITQIKQINGEFDKLEVNMQEQSK
jgi:hypothetical protein